MSPKLYSFERVVVFAIRSLPRRMSRKSLHPVVAEEIAKGKRKELFKQWVRGFCAVQ